MNRILVNLLKFQMLIALMTVIITAIFVPAYWKSVLAGTSISLIATCAIKLMLSRMPTVIRSREFYGMMIVSEVVKWLVVIILTIIYLKINLNALGIVFGFSITYIISYMLTWLRK